MKKSISILSMLFIALLACFSVKGQEKQGLTFKLADPSKPGQLNVEIFDGSVKIIGYSGKEVIIDPVGKYDPDKLFLSQKNNVISLTVDKPNEMSFIIKVPTNFSIFIRIQAAGEIYAENVNGNHDVALISGNITMLKVSGSISANSKNGNVNVEVNPVNGPLALSNVMGNIELTIPDRQKANIKMQTEFARVYSEFPVDQDPTEPKQSSNGNKTLNGKINGGGSLILLKSVGGKVYLKRGTIMSN